MTGAASGTANDPGGRRPAAEGRLDLDLPAGRPSPQSAPRGSRSQANRRPTLGGTTLRGFIVSTVVTAIAFFVLTQLLPKYTSFDMITYDGELSGSVSSRSSSGSSTG